MERGEENPGNLEIKRGTTGQGVRNIRKTSHGGHVVCQHAAMAMEKDQKQTFQIST